MGKEVAVSDPASGNSDWEGSEWLGCALNTEHWLTVLLLTCASLKLEQVNAPQWSLVVAERVPDLLAALAAVPHSGWTFLCGERNECLS